MKIQKRYILDEDGQPIAVQVPIDQFRQMENVIESYGLARLMEETRDDERLSEEAFFGFAPLPKRGNTVTNELINRLRDPT